MQNQHPVFQVEYYDTYDFVAFIHELAENGFPTPDFYDGFYDFIKNHTGKIFYPFQKVSVLHQFISFSVYESFKENVDDVVLDNVINQKDYVLWVNSALNVHKISHLDFNAWLDKQSLSIENVNNESVILDYYGYLYKAGSLKYLLEKISNEVFFVLFLNRHFLYLFNKRISPQTKEIKIIDLPENIKQLFKKDGILKRVNIPVWSRKAVFYRDRGLCSNCQKDISGLVNIHNAKHFDHIIPLAFGGLNDISNLQLLCETCNLKKSGKEIQASKVYEKWY
ncbi:MAG: HNH endonuclease signature motif containing protein [Methylococcaceae bacterium]